LKGAPPLCSVVIPSYDGRHWLATCLASIERHRPESRGGPAIEVIVADDASRDDTGSWLAATYPQVRHVRLERNGGFCAAANAGIAAARGEFIELLNNDTEVTAGWIEAGLGPFSDPTVGSVAPLVLVRSDPARVDSAGDTYAVVGWPSKRGHGEDARPWHARPPGPVFAASGSSAFYRAAALRKVGAFDPAYHSYYEDVDLAFRLRWAGYTTVFTPHCRVLHEVSATYDHARPALQRRMSRNAEFLFWSNLPARWLAMAVIPHLAFTLAQGFWRLLRGRAGAFWLGKWDALRLFQGLPSRRRLRAELARGSIAPPHFPLRVGLWREARNHLRRPREASSRPAL
jgi:GT2 family glycosyltransferase